LATGCTSWGWVWRQGRTLTKTRFDVCAAQLLSWAAEGWSNQRSRKRCHQDPSSRAAWTIQDQQDRVNNRPTRLICLTGYSVSWNVYTRVLQKETWADNQFQTIRCSYIYVLKKVISRMALASSIPPYTVQFSHPAFVYVCLFVYMLLYLSPSHGFLQSAWDKHNQ
jgi:hypothetical protein